MPPFSWQCGPGKGGTQMRKKTTLPKFDPTEIRQGLQKSHADHLAKSVAEGRITLKEAARQRAWHVSRNHQLINEGITRLLDFLVWDSKPPAERAAMIAEAIDVDKFSDDIDQ